MTDDALSNLLHEDRRFPPPEDIAANANVTAETYAEAEADFDGFWAEQAERLSWQTKPTQVLDWSKPPFAKWFADGTLERRIQLPRSPRRGGQRRSRCLLF